MCPQLRGSLQASTAVWELDRRQIIPGGTQICSSPLGIHLPTETFGSDAGLFRPERWLAASPEMFAKTTGTVDLAFPYGRYQYLGINLSLMEFNIVFVEVSVVIAYGHDRNSSQSY